MVGTPPGASLLNQMEVILINIEWSGPPMTSQAIDAKLSIRGRLKEAKISKWEAEGGNSFYLDEIGEFEKELSKALEAVTVKQTLSERKILGIATWKNLSLSTCMFGVWKSTLSLFCQSTGLEIIPIKSLCCCLLMMILVCLGG